MSQPPIVHISGPMSTLLDPIRLIAESGAGFVIVPTFKSRLIDAAQHRRIPPSQTAIGLSLGLRKQTVDQWFKGGNPSAVHLSLIRDKWGVSIDWLITGQGAMTLPLEKHPSLPNGADKALHALIEAWDTLYADGQEFLAGEALDLAKKVRTGQRPKRAASNHGLQGSRPRVTGGGSKANPATSGSRRR